MLLAVSVRTAESNDAWTEGQKGVVPLGTQGEGDHVVPNPRVEPTDRARTLPASAMGVKRSINVHHKINVARSPCDPNPTAANDGAHDNCSIRRANASVLTRLS